MSMDVENSVENEVKADGDTAVVESPSNKDSPLCNNEGNLAREDNTPTVTAVLKYDKGKEASQEQDPKKRHKRGNSSFSNDTTVRVGNSLVNKIVVRETSSLTEKASVQPKLEQSLTSVTLQNEKSPCATIKQKFVLDDEGQRGLRPDESLEFTLQDHKLM